MKELLDMKGLMQHGQDICEAREADPDYVLGVRLLQVARQPHPPGILHLGGLRKNITHGKYAEIR